MIEGRLNHTSLFYQDKIYSFGGNFMFNKKRNARELSN